ncbi:MAG: C10 family peptidase [Bacteroidaceae bacterium]|nr:C10 family peptidase [Bacteroidaceae bacterium]
MKKITLLICTFLSLAVLVPGISTLKAEPIGKNAARYTARAFMLAKGKQLSASKPSQMKASGYTTAGDESEQPYYYVFNAGDDGGYVIVSGDDRVEPILGYVDRGTFDPENIPENMRSWLQLYADQIKFIIDNDIQPGDPRIQKRNKVQATKHSIPELMMSRWNQGNPYNLTCPQYYKEDGTRALPASGCAATAMAQVINFYKYPDKTAAQIPSHSNTYTLSNGTKKTVTARAVPKNTKIDWENMRDTYSCGSDHEHDRPDTAVANLMLYCGQSLKMGWGGSSGADTSRSRDALVNYFGFDARAFWAERPNYTIDEWANMLYDELEAGYPVLYRGHSSGGGHAFVIDGFDGDNLFHVNWGWGGGSNGWFLISILNPGDTSGIGASSSSDGYSMTQGGCFNLRTPDTPRESYLTISDVSITSTSIRAKFTNKTGVKGTFHTGIVMLDENGGLALVGSKQTISGIADGNAQFKTFPIAGKLPAGTYKLSPASKPSKSETWRAKFNMHNEYIEAVVDSLGNTDIHFPYPTYEDISIDTITFPGTRIVGKEQEVKVTFRNNGKEYFKTVYFLASKTQTKVYTKSKSMVSVRSGETVDVSYFFKPEETGTYNLWFCTDEKGSNVVGQGTMDIITEAEAVQANLSITSFDIKNLVNEAAVGKRLIGQAKIKNNGSQPYNASVKLQIWSQKVGSSTAYSGSTRSFPVDIAPGKTGVVDFEFDGLSEGYYYRIKAMYSNQDGTLGGGGIWDHRWEMKPGILIWKADGSVDGKAYSASMNAGTTTVGFFANCNKITRLTLNRNNRNVIYAFAPDMTLPKTNNTFNAVIGNHADRIDLVNDQAYYIPISFDADSASFTYTFPETEDGTGWHAFTMPFASDSLLLDSVPVALTDSLNHFWIYEFGAEGNSGEPIFKPATELRGGTPYIIAGDSTMAGRSLVFHALRVPFFKTGSDKMLVTSPSFKFHGNTLQPKLKECFVLNEEGTAFEYTTTIKTLNAMEPYFTTNIADTLAPASIILPDVPVRPVQEVTLDEMASEPVISGTYDVLTLKRSFEAGLNTICLPFRVDDIAAVFGEGAAAYEFYGLTGHEIDFGKTESLAAGVPYLIVLPEAIADDIVLSNVTIDEESIEAGFIEKYGISFRGTYQPQEMDNGQWIMGDKLLNVFNVAADATLAANSEVGGFRAFLCLPDSEEGYTIRLWDDATAIRAIANGQWTGDDETYDLSGRKVANGNRLNGKSKGIFITNGKKVLK